MTLTVPLALLNQVPAARTEWMVPGLIREKVRAMAKSMGASGVRSWNEYRKLDQERRFGQEIWQPLLFVMVALMFGELLLQQLFARRRL